LLSTLLVPQQVPIGFNAVRQNGLTGYVALGRVFTPGLYFLPLRQTFILFPSTLVTIEFSERGINSTTSDLGFARPDGPPIETRTGKDAGDPDSGGQPVTLSLSFQIRIPVDHVGRVYNSFSTEWRARYVLLARNVVNTVATRYTSTEFWTERRKISDDLGSSLNETLAAQGCAVEGAVQLLRVDFQDKYEDLITETQLQSQKKITNEYQMQVTKLLKELDVRSAGVDAESQAIRAIAEAEAASMINQAMADGFGVEQAAKAEAFARAKEKLNLSNDEVLQYVKLNAMRHRGSKGKTTLGLSYSEFAP